MSSRAFIVRCPNCNAVTAAYCTVRSDPKEIGEAVMRAAQNNQMIDLVSGSVRVCSCTCWGNPANERGSTLMDAGSLPAGTTEMDAEP